MKQVFLNPDIFYPLKKSFPALLHFLYIMDRMCKMRKHPVRKFLGLTVLYAVIIVGIFVLQFKTESIFSRNLGAMRITLAQTETESNIMELRNQLQVSFRGMVFAFDDKNPCLALDSEGSVSSLTLASWVQKNDYAADFFFDDGSILSFAVNDASPSAQLSVNAQFSKDCNEILLPYKPASNATVDGVTEKSIILSSRGDYYILNAPLLEDGKLHLQKNNPLAAMVSYNPVQSFAFEQTVGVEGADLASYENAVKLLRASVESRVAQKISGSEADRISESEVVAYVAEMASQGHYSEAVEAIPESFLRGNSRTYLSAPYFARLVDMNRTLVTQNERLSAMVDNAIATGNADIFTIDSISDYLLRIKKTSRGKAMLEVIASKENFTPNLSQATGILSVYVTLMEKDSGFASTLSPLVQSCIDVIRSNCSLEDGVLDLTEGGLPATTSLSVQTGKALLSYGKLVSDEAAVCAGSLMVSTALSSLQNVDLRVLAELYPLLVENKYYPHTQILGYYGSTPVWAWTCSGGISYTVEEEGVVNINIDFAQGLAHYVMFYGIPDFHGQIEIQKIMFRTDPRFETYNSSGYVYRADESAFFLKSKHKSRTELVRLWCNPDLVFSKP